MSDITVSLTSGPITFTAVPNTVNVTLGAGITVLFPVAVAPTPESVAAAVSAWPEYISNEEALADNVNAYRAAAGHEGAYPGTLIYTE